MLGTFQVQLILDSEVTTGRWLAWVLPTGDARDAAAVSSSAAAD